MANKEDDILATSVKEKIATVLDKDESRWIKLFDRDYLAYNMQYNLSKFRSR